MSRTKGKRNRVVREKVHRENGVCARWGCSEATPNHRYKWCGDCREKVRRAQMRLNAFAHEHRARMIEPHVMYAGRPTEWAIRNPDRAIARARANPHFNMPLIAFEALLEKAVEQRKMQEEGMRIRN